MIPAALLAAGLAWADDTGLDPCASAGDGFIDGPTGAWFQDGELGAPRRTCTRSEVAAAGGGRITADTANFYGYIVGSFDVDGSAQVADGVEVFGHLEAVRLDLAIASLSDSNLGLGHLSVGAAVADVPVDRLALGGHVKLVLPTATGLYKYGRPFGVELAVSSTWQPHKWVRVHDSVTGVIEAGTGVVALPRGGLLLNVGVEFRPLTELGLVADVDAGFLRTMQSPVAETTPVDLVSVGGALRFGDGRRFGFEVGARAPVAGRERAVITAQLRGSVRLGAIAPRR